MYPDSEFSGTESQPHMALCINKSMKSVQLLLDTSISTYGEWIPGEGGDICLLRDNVTGKVVGCDLPLYQDKLVITEI